MKKIILLPILSVLLLAGCGNQPKELIPCELTKEDFDALMEKIHKNGFSYTLHEELKFFQEGKESEAESYEEDRKLTIDAINKEVSYLTYKNGLDKPLASGEIIKNRNRYNLLAIPEWRDDGHVSDEEIDECISTYYECSSFTDFIYSEDFEDYEFNPDTMEYTYVYKYERREEGSGDIYSETIYTNIYKFNKDTVISATCGYLDYYVNEEGIKEYQKNTMVFSELSVGKQKVDDSLTKATFSFENKSLTINYIDIVSDLPDQNDPDIIALKEKLTNSTIEFGKDTFAWKDKDNNVFKTGTYSKNNDQLIINVTKSAVGSEMVDTNETILIELYCLHSEYNVASSVGEVTFMLDFVL